MTIAFSLARERWSVPEILAPGIVDQHPAVVGQAAPILLEPGQFHEHYEGPTLTDSICAPARYGPAPGCGNLGEVTIGAPASLAPSGINSK